MAEVKHDAILAYLEAPNLVITAYPPKEYIGTKTDRIELDIVVNNESIYEKEFVHSELIKKLKQESLGKIFPEISEKLEGKVSNEELIKYLSDKKTAFGLNSYSITWISMLTS